MVTKKQLDTVKKLKTTEELTWCPGCPNFMILEGVKHAMADLIQKKKYKQTDFAMTTDIGCNSKIFDYLNISGVYGLHGRALPTAIGIRLGNPKLKTLCFAGDGAIYSEGISHLIHAFRYNADVTLLVHDNQAFSLTTGQPTATSQQGFSSKADPKGVQDLPLNPIELALACKATFIARCNARDFKHTAEIVKKAIAHKGFSYVEIMQDCLIFNKLINGKDGIMYKVKDNTDLKTAEKYAKQYEYNSKKGKIPLGVLYKVNQPELLEKRPLLARKLNKK